MVMVRVHKYRDRSRSRRNNLGIYLLAGTIRGVSRSYSKNTEYRRLNSSFLPTHFLPLLPAIILYATNIYDEKLNAKNTFHLHFFSQLDDAKVCLENRATKKFNFNRS